MIPILYRADETSFVSNGLGRLTECTSCIVTEERNGIFECEFKYPITGRFYKTLIEEGGIVAVIHDDKHDIQPFDIYSFSAPIDGVVTFFAHHISYRLGNIIVSPYVAESCATAFANLKTFSVNKNDFTFWTDKTTEGEFKLTHPDNLRALLGGQEGSILDVYGTGEYEFDKYEVRLYVNRGADTGVTIRYGKNMTDIERQYSEESTFNAVAPYWADSEGNVVMLSDYIVISPDAPLVEAPWTADTGDYITDDNGEIIYFQYVKLIPKALDLSNSFEEEPSEAELRQKALEYLANNQPWTPSDNVTVDFVQLWQTPEYENVANLQRVSLCDTVSIYYPELGVTKANAKIIKVVYNVLLERYDSMEVGTPKVSLADYLKGDIAAAILEQPELTAWQSAIIHATEMITGGLGGHVVMTPNADGQPQEILIMDTDDVETAVNVIRMNKNGIGFSQTGYEGPFESAWTIDGHFNANFIATGSILCDFIRGGILQLGGFGNYGGSIHVQDADGNLLLLIGSTGLYGKDPDGNQIFSLTKYGAFLNQGVISLQATDENDNQFNFSARVDGQYSIDRGMQVFQTLSGYSSSAYRTKVMPECVLTQTDSTYGAPYEATGAIWPGLAGSTECLFAIGGTFSPYLSYLINLQDYTAIGPLGVRVHKWYALESQIDAELNKTRIFTKGDIECNGTKSRIVKADEYGNRLLYCYETPSPLFGDVGEGVLDETGICYVFLEPIFAETITGQYQVFLQKYGNGDCWVSKRGSDHFVVQGDPGLSFGWELKAKQKGYDHLRFDKKMPEIEKGIDYGECGNDFYINLEEGRTA